MFFKQIEVGEMQNFCYIIGANGEAAVVDPGWEYERILEICKKNHLRIKKILLTHGHFDHIKDLKRIIEKTNADIYLHRLEKINIENLNFTYLKGGEEISIGNVKIKVIHTPGHTPGSVCYFFENKLLTGDTVFVGSVGRTDLPGGNLADLIESLERIKSLGDKVEIYPGHDYGKTKSSTIGEEKIKNELFKIN